MLQVLLVGSQEKRLIGPQWRQQLGYVHVRQEAECKEELQWVMLAIGNQDLSAWWAFHLNSCRFSWIMTVNMITVQYCLIQHVMSD